MSKAYEVELSIQGITKFKNKLNKINKILSSEDFIEYLEGKCFQELLRVTDISVNDINYHSVSEDITRYRTNHQHEHEGNVITLWNDTMVNFDELNVSDETRAKYPNGLSLAKIVEFGTGIVGANSEASKYAENWQYDVNSHGNKGWFYKDRTGQLQWSRGINGKLVFLNTKKRIEKNIENWVTEYIDKKLGE